MCRRTHSGQALFEVVIAMGLLVLFISSFARLTLGSHETGRQGREQTIAVYYAQEGLEAARSIAQANWSSLTGTSLGIDVLTGAYVFSGSSNVMGKYTRTVSFHDVMRNANNAIVQTGGTEDEKTRKATSSVQWQFGEGRSKTISLVTYLTQWFDVSLRQWIIDLQSEFLEGDQHGTTVIANDDGEVRLAITVDMAALSTYFMEDTPGRGDILGIEIDPVQDRLYMVTSSNTNGSSDEFFAYDISATSEGVLTLAGAVDLGDTSTDLAIGGDYAYTLNNGVEIQVVALTGASAMTIVASWDIPGTVNPNSIIVDTTNNRAYVVTLSDWSGEEFWILDITDPEAAAISILGQTEIGADVNDVAVYPSHDSGQVPQYAYVVTDDTAQELRIIDLASPSTVVACNLLGNQVATAIQIHGTNAYIGREQGGQSELMALAIDPSNPDDCAYMLANVIGEENLADDVLDMEIAEDEGYAFIAMDSTSDQLAVVSLSDYSSSTLDVDGGTCDSIAFYGSFIYSGCQHNTRTLHVNRGSPGGWALPEEAGDGNVPGNDVAWAIAVSDSYVFVGTEPDNNDAEFWAFDKSSGVSFGMSTVAGSLEIGEQVNDIYIDGNYAYLATAHDSKELIIVDISGLPGSMTEVGSFDAERDRDAYGVFASGNRAYIVTDNNNQNTSPGNPRDEFYVIDVSNSASPSQVGDGYDVGADANGVVVSGNYAYLATDQNAQELLVLDLSNPTAPTYHAALDTPTNVNGEKIDINGSIIHLITTDDYYAIDISDSSNPIQGGTFDFANDNMDIAVDTIDSNYVFIATDDTASELRIINVTDPYNIRLTKAYDLPGNDPCNGVAFDGDYVYLACETNAKELRVVKPQDLVSSFAWNGSFTSPVFDSGVTGTVWNEISWTESGSGGVTFRVRTEASTGALLSTPWVGSDGTIPSVYSVHTGESIVPDPSVSDHRLIQWKAYFTGTGAGTPILEDVTITYE